MSQIVTRQRARALLSCNNANGIDNKSPSDVSVVAGVEGSAIYCSKEIDGERDQSIPLGPNVLGTFSCHSWFAPYLYSTVVAHRITYNNLALQG
jgi:hypothetical protein